VWPGAWVGTSANLDYSKDRNAYDGISLGNKRLTLETKQSLSVRVQGMSRLRSRIATGTNGSELTVFLYGEILKAGWFLLDSGNLDASLLAPHMALNREENPIESTDEWETRFSLDGYTDMVTDFRTKDIIYDGALSEAFMSELIFTFDLVSNSIWVKSVE